MLLEKIYSIFLNIYSQKMIFLFELGFSATLKPQDLRGAAVLSDPCEEEGNTHCEHFSTSRDYAQKGIMFMMFWS